MRKYYKYIDNNWIAPTIAENRLIGGSFFAVESSSVSSAHTTQYAWKQFADDIWIGNAPTQWFTFYNPNSLNIKEIVLADNNGSTSYLAKDFIFQGSDDNENWTTIYTNTVRTTGNFTIDLSSNNNFYKYHRFYITSVLSGSYTLIGKFISITAIEREIVESTSEDYDFYKDVDIYKSLVKTVRKYYKYVEQEWTQPILTSLGTADVDSMALENVNSPSSPLNLFDGNTGSLYQINNSDGGYKDFIIIFKNQVKLTSADFLSYNSAYVSGGPGLIYIYGSLDKETWTEVMSYTAGQKGDNAHYLLSAETPDFYKYYKISMRHGSVSSYYWGNLREGYLYGTEKVIQETDISDYDFYKDEKVYSTLVNTTQIFHPYVYEYKTTGTYELTIPEDAYIVEIYGAGGGVAICGYNSYYTNRGGGSGAGFKGTMHIPAGTYTVIVGSGGASSNSAAASSGNGGDSSIGNLIIAGGGLGSTILYLSETSRYGTGGTLTVDESIFIGTPEIQTDGNQGNLTNYVYGGYDISVIGGASVQNNTMQGYGAGGSYSGGLSGTGLDGYVKITATTDGYYTTQYRHSFLNL